MDISLQDRGAHGACNTYENGFGLHAKPPKGLSSAVPPGTVQSVDNLTLDFVDKPSGHDVRSIHVQAA